MSHRNTKFTTELLFLINKHSIDNDLNIPDYIITEHIVKSLEVLKETVSTRDFWFNFKPRELLSNTKD